jgi:hypothetical protein
MTQALLLLFNTTRETLRTPAAAAVKHKRAHSAAAAARGSGILFFMFYTIGFTQLVLHKLFYTRAME